MNRIKVLEVFLNEDKVGTLAVMKNGCSAFEYDAKWLKEGFSVSPFSLPLEKKVFIPKPDPFEGLFGVFADSLPDGWGRLLVDRMLLKRNINPHTIDSLNRLAVVGYTGMGALHYQPIHLIAEESRQSDYDKIAQECKRLLEDKDTGDLDNLFLLGGSSGGARPKILTEIEGEKWIVKFPSSFDKDNIGEMEFRYSECAKACGIEMPETRLFPSKRCSGYFGVKRFDRFQDTEGNEKRIHMISVSALLETSHRFPNLDYHDLMKLVSILTNDEQEMEKMFRLMCFNVYAHNRDDHSRNFTFLYDQREDKWRLSPAYDLTYSYSLGGEHATCVNGNGSDPDLHSILAVADKAGMNKADAMKIAAAVQEIVQEYNLVRYK